VLEAESSVGVGGVADGGRLRERLEEVRARLDGIIGDMSGGAEEQRSRTADERDIAVWCWRASS
jgi:hypothetical protein